MSGRQLFLDTRQITRMERLQRRVHQPRRHADNPVLRGENDWEALASLYGTVLYDVVQKRFQMWYLTGPGRPGMVQVRGRQALGNITLLGYATSTDGVHWEKPVLNQVDFEGSTANNLIDIGRTNCEGMAVLYDEADPDPGRRYKGFYWEHGGIDTFITWEDGRLLWGEGEGDGMWMSFSPDGVHWSNCPTNPVIGLGSDTTQSLLRDPATGQYAAYGRFGAGGRKVARATSADAVQFEAPKLVFECDEVDEEGTQFYGMPLALYEGIYIGMPWIYREGVDGTIDTSLATSRDGVQWERVLDRQTFLSLGEAGSWEDGMVRITQNFNIVGDEIYLYYGGVQGPHTGRKFKTVERRTSSMLGLAVLRRDGFVSVDAGDDEGFMLTKPLTVDGASLHANAAPQTGGWVWAVVTDEEGVPLEGYASQKLEVDKVDAELIFARPLAELAGRTVRLRWEMQRAGLFSYWFV
ncbi:MAG: hypothetical protein GKR89_32640 [Candidatus Latescibacteria bacterium]|nr:hypothetical protein [Candidatus Latescibacterota bacterium]